MLEPSMFFAVLCMVVLIVCVRLLRPARARWQLVTDAPQAKVLAIFMPFLDRLRNRSLRTAGRPQVEPGPPTPTPGQPPPIPPESDPSFRVTFAVTLACAVVFVILGQFVFILDESRHRVGLALIALGLALFLFARLVYTKREAPRWLRVIAERLSVQPFQLILILLGLGGAATARSFAGDGALMSHPWLALLAYVGGVGVLVVGWGRREPPPETQATSILGPPWSRREIALVTALTAFAFLVRALDNGNIPAALTGDEGSSGLMAVEFIKGTFNNPFVMGWYSFPSMYFTLPALSIAIGGHTYSALRMPSAIAGALTVLGLYWMVRPMFGRAAAGLSAALLSTLNLHLHFSRIGLNNIWDGAFAVWAIGIFWRGWQTGRRRDFIVAGFLIGLSQYFYASARLIPVILLVWLLLRLPTDWKNGKKRLPDLLALGTIAIAVALPLALFYIAHPPEFVAPLERFSIFSNHWLTTTAAEQHRSVWLVLLENFRDGALGFTSKPLVNWYQSGSPMLQPLPAGLFLLGVLLTILNLRDARYWLVLLWLLGVAGIGGMTLNPPGSQRYVIGAPAAALAAGIAIQTLAHWASDVFPRRRAWAYGLAVLIAIIAMGADLRYYFAEYVPDGGFGDPNTQIATQLGHFLEDYPAGSQAYFFGAPRMGYYGFSTIPYLAPQVTGIEVTEPLQSPPEWQLTGPTVFAFLPERESELALVQQSYPGGELVPLTARDGNPLFVIYEVGAP